jgi:hypothetical protein
MSFKEQLIKINACDEAIKWVGDRTLTEAWSECPRGDWMLWGLAKMIGQPGWPSHQEVVRHTCWCVRRAEKHIPSGESRPCLLIETINGWVRNIISKADVRTALIDMEWIELSNVESGDVVDVVSDTIFAIKSAAKAALDEDRVALHVCRAARWAEIACTNAERHARGQVTTMDGLIDALGRKHSASKEAMAQAEYLRAEVSIPEVSS